MNVASAASRRAVAAALSLLVTAGAAGCGETTAPPPPSPSPRPSAAPVDRLDEDELAEGPVSAFGLPLPAGLRVDARGGDRVSASGPAPFEDVANYVRSRVSAVQTTTGPGKTLFDRVTIRSPRPLHEREKPRATGDDEEEVLRIDVATTSRGWTQIVVSRDVRKKPVQGLTEDQRWERLGLTKDGKPADPRAFE